MCYVKCMEYLVLTNLTWSAAHVSHSKSFTGDQLNFERFELNCLDFQGALTANRILFPISLTTRKRGNLNIKPRFFYGGKKFSPKWFEISKRSRLLNSKLKEPLYCFGRQICSDGALCSKLQLFEIRVNQQLSTWSGWSTELSRATCPSQMG